MKFFFAATEAELFQDIIFKEGGRNILLSYYWLKDKDISRIKLNKKIKECNIFIDSGGFSARKSGVDVDIYRYRDFLKENREYIDYAANLDVNSLEISLENQKILEEEFPVLPVYHIQEYISKDKEILEKYCKKYKHIALGGIAGNSFNKKLLTNFLNYCFKIVMKYKIKVHGFGINSPKIVMNYPFYSVDSTVWLKGGQFGTIIKWKDYKLESSIHTSNSDKYIKHNFSIKLIEDYKERLAHNVSEILKMEKDITKLWEKRGIKYN